MSYAPAKFDKPPAKWAEPLETPRENYLGLAGFVVSILGLIFTCGVLSPVGLLISMAGLFSRPRGYAVAGVITGLLGSLWIVLIAAAFWVMAAVGVAAKPAIEEFVKQVGETATNVNSIADARNKIEDFRKENNRLPEGVEGNKLIAEHKDAKGNSLRYDVEENGYRIRSAGADQKFETEDDITDAQVDAYLKAMDEAKKAHHESQSQNPPEIKLPDLPPPQP